MKPIQNYYSKKTKAWASALGDMFLVMIPVVGTLIEQAPNMSEAQKYWWAGAFTTFSIGLKFILKLVKDEKITD